MNATQAWVVVADDPAVTGLVDVARALGDEVVAVVVGDRAVAETVALAVDRVVWLGETGAAPVESFAAQVAEIVVAAGPLAVVGATTASGRALLGGVAARSQSPVLAGVRTVAVTDGHVVVTHAVMGGIAERTVAVNGGPALLAVDAGAVPVGSATAPVDEVAGAPLTVATVTDVRRKPQSRADLGAAKVVVGVGRGLKARADLPLVVALADALQGEVACSRPLAEGVDWMPKETYIGISGQHIAPELYVAVAISGQLQHMLGVREAKVIVAVNSDKNAPVFAQCDYGIVGDLYQVVPALTAALEGGA